MFRVFLCCVILAVAAADSTIASENIPSAACLVVITHGQDFEDEKGYSSEIGQDGWLRSYARSVQQQPSVTAIWLHTWPSFGGSGPVATRLAEQIKNYMEQNGASVTNVILIGHSRGGVLAAAVAEHVERFKSPSLGHSLVIAIDPTPSKIHRDRTHFAALPSVRTVVFDDGLPFLEGLTDSCKFEGARTINLRDELSRELPSETIGGEAYCAMSHLAIRQVVVRRYLPGILSEFCKRVDSPHHGRPAEVTVIRDHGRWVEDLLRSHLQDKSAIDDSSTLHRFFQTP